MELEPDLSPLRPACTCARDVECLVCKAYRLKIPLGALAEMPSVESQSAFRVMVEHRRRALRKLCRRRRDIQLRLKSVASLEEELAVLGATIANEQRVLAQQQRLLDGTTAPARRPGRAARKVHV